MGWTGFLKTIIWYSSLSCPLESIVDIINGVKGRIHQPTIQGLCCLKWKYTVRSKKLSSACVSERMKEILVRCPVIHALIKAVSPSFGIDIGHPTEIFLTLTVLYWYNRSLQFTQVNDNRQLSFPPFSGRRIHWASACLAGCQVNIKQAIVFHLVPCLVTWQGNIYPPSSPAPKPSLVNFCRHFPSADDTVVWDAAGQ